MLPRRRRLPHATPLGLPPERELFFVTICARPRGTTPLLASHRAVGVLEAVRHRHETGLWFAHLFLLMPDHTHAILRFPDGAMPRVVADFKRFTARRHGIPWQAGFFDHRLRREESLDQAAEYIRHNPVRAGLCREPEDWPHVFRAESASR